MFWACRLEPTAAEGETKMPWYHGDYPPSYKNQPRYLREKAVEIANEIIKESGEEGLAIATGLKKARQYFQDHPEEKPVNTR